MAGSTATIPVQYTQDVYQVADTFTWVKGAPHLARSGFDWQNYHFDGFSYSRYGGEFRFRNLTEFLTLRRSATAQADRFTGNLPGTDTQAPRAAALRRRCSRRTTGALRQPASACRPGCATSSSPIPTS